MSWHMQEAWVDWGRCDSLKHCLKNWCEALKGCACYTIIIVFFLIISFANMVRPVVLQPSCSCCQQGS